MGVKTIFTVGDWEVVKNFWVIFFFFGIFYNFIAPF